MTTESKILPVIEGFTQEPWKALALGVSCPSERVTLKSGREVPRQIAVVKDHEGQISRERLYADAHLIAAAPTLYRIAHEQREVIRRQDAALRASLEALELYHAYGWPDRAGVRAKLKTEVAAAAPFLED